MLYFLLELENGTARDDVERKPIETRLRMLVKYGLASVTVTKKGAEMLEKKE